MVIIRVTCIDGDTVTFRDVTDYLYSDTSRAYQIRRGECEYYNVVSRDQVKYIEVWQEERRP